MAGTSSLVYPTQGAQKNEARKNLFLKVEVHRDGAVERSYLVDYSYYRTKVWVVKTLVWCSLKGRTFLLRGATESEVKSETLFKPKDSKEAANG